MRTWVGMALIMKSVFDNTALLVPMCGLRKHETSQRVCVWRNLFSNSGCVVLCCSSILLVQTHTKPIHFIQFEGHTMGRPLNRLGGREEPRGLDGGLAQHQDPVRQAEVQIPALVLNDVQYAGKADDHLGGECLRLPFGLLLLSHY